MTTSSSAEKLQMNDPIDINKDNNRLPNTTTNSQMSASPVMGVCSEIVMEVDPSAGLLGPNDCAGVTNGLSLLAYSEGMSAFTSVGPGTPISTTPPAMLAFSLTRFTDGYSAQFRSLLITGTTIPFIEISWNTQGGNPVQTIIIRYEDCIINSISGGASSGEDNPTENITFDFTRACYRYFHLDDSGNQDGQIDACIDKNLIDQSTCACDMF